MRRTRWDAAFDKRRAIKSAEASGIVADSLEVRTALIKKMHAGEMTLEEVQAELARIKRAAKRNGQLTRNQVWRQS